MWPETALQAMREAKRLELRYDDRHRVVEVHAVGYSHEGDGLMLGWQVRGESHSSPVGWKLLRLDGTRSFSVLDEPSEAPRPGYAGANKAISEVLAQL